MLTIKKRGLTFQVLSVIVVSATFLTACGPPGPRALQKGERLVAAGKFPEAVAKFEEATKLLTNAPAAEQAQAWNWLGVARHHAGLAVPASQAYQTALRLDRNLAPAAYNLGCLLLELKYYREGIDQLMTCLQLPRPAEISEHDVYLKIGSAYLHQANQLSGAERIRQFDAARRFLERSYQIAPSAEAVNGLGMVFLQRHRSPNEAVTRFKEALRLQPNYPPALLNLAITHHYYLNDRRLGLQEYKTYLALQPPPANAKEVEAVAHELEHELAAPPAAPAAPAINTNAAPAPPKPVQSEKADLEKTNAPVATKDSAHVEVAMASEQAKSPVSSPAVSLIAAAPAPTNSPSAPAVTHIPERPKAPVAAVALAPARWHYVAAAKPAPGNREEAARWIAQGLQAQRATNWVEALNAYRSAAKADPSSFEASYRLGTAAQETGNLTASLESFERAVSLSPESVEARYAFGWALYKGKYSQDSAQELEGLLKQAPSETRAHLLLANIYAHDLNQPSLAREHYMKVLEIEPRHSQAAAIRAWLATGGL